MLAELPLQLEYNTSNMSIITDNIAVYSFNNASYQEEQVGIIIKDIFHEDQTIDAHTNMAHLEEVVLDFGSVRSGKFLLLFKLWIIRSGTFYTVIEFFWV